MSNCPTKYAQSFYKRSLTDYERFIRLYRPDRFHDKKPLFPVTAIDLCHYIDHKHKIDHFRYTTLQRYLSALRYHPKHGMQWKKSVLRSKIVETKKLEIRKSRGHIYLPKPTVNEASGLNKNGYIFTAPTPPAPKKPRAAKIQKAMVPTLQYMKKKAPLSVTPTGDIIQEKSVPAGTIKLNVNKLASKVRIISYTTPVSLYSLSLDCSKDK